MTTRIMMADSHRMLCESLSIPLAAAGDLAIVAEAGSGAEALDRLAAVVPDLLLLDAALPDMAGSEVARRALARQPGLRIVALSGCADIACVNEMLKAGARAYVVKSAGMQELVFAIRATLAGHVFLSPEITAAMLGQQEPAASPAPAPSLLGRREQDVLRCLAQGMRSAEIGAELGILPATVDVHRSNIRKKLGLNSTAELTRYAIRAGLFTE